MSNVRRRGGPGVQRRVEGSVASNVVIECGEAQGRRIIKAVT
jgi:hypothetical protein